MPIDPQRVLGAQIGETTHRWDIDDVILYHLGVGAGNPPTDVGELEYTYESNLKVLPSFATIPMFSAMMSILDIDGLDINPAMILHGEQVIEVNGPIPVEATVTNHATVEELYDKGKGALVVLRIESRDETDSVLFVNTASIYVRGEGGFGGEPGPEPANVAPDRPADHTVSSATLPQQALLYRLSGDKNPLHADPAFAAFGGFDRPILHGLCSFGIVCKAVVDTVLEGEVGAVARFGARFSGVAYPGETIVTRMWRESDGWIVDARTAERDSPVISNARIGVANGP
ncbi:MAG: MaoC/PaaZ C-terminal domain-containing protein [Acidimicrobiia bacterium]